jgi:hypothetical protein
VKKECASEASGAGSNSNIFASDRRSEDRVGNNRVWKDSAYCTAKK